MLLPLWGMYRETFLAGPVVVVASDTLVNGTEGSEISGVTGVAATDVFTKTLHGLVDGNLVILRALTGGVGLKTEHPYFIISGAANTFKLSETYGGASIDFVTNLTDGSVYQVDFYSAAVWVSRFEGIKTPIGTITVTFTPDAGSASKVYFEFQVSQDGTNWSTAYWQRIEVATNEAADGDGVVRYSEMVPLYGIGYIRLSRIVNNDAANDITDCNATISF